MTAKGAVHELVSALDYPMFIVTATDGVENAGCLVGFTTQASIDPPRFLVCLSVKNRTFRVAQRTDTLVVHLVPDTADDLAQLFGSHTADDDFDKFQHADWRPGPNGTPVLTACSNWFAGRILERIPAGDHHALLLDPFAAHGDEGERGFAFHRARRLEPGHEA